MNVNALFCGTQGKVWLSPITAYIGIHNFDRKLWNYRPRICSFQVLLYLQTLAWLWPYKAETCSYAKEYLCQRCYLFLLIHPSRFAQYGEFRLSVISAISNKIRLKYSKLNQCMNISLSSSDRGAGQIRQSHWRGYPRLRTYNCDYWDRCANKKF